MEVNPENRNTERKNEMNRANRVYMEMISKVGGDFKREGDKTAERPWQRSREALIKSAFLAGTSMGPPPLQRLERRVSSRFFKCWLYLIEVSITVFFGYGEKA